MESSRKPPAVTAATSAVSASASDCKSPSLEKQNDYHKISPVQLLDKLMTMVEPKQGKGVAVRKVTRELRTVLYDQSERLKKDCPVGNVPDNIRAWCTGVRGECSECDMNHFLVELHRIAERLYESTAVDHKFKIAKWLDEGTDDYVSEIRDLISTSWIGQLLTDITAQEKVITKASEFESVKETQVSANTHTHTLTTSLTKHTLTASHTSTYVYTLRI